MGNISTTTWQKILRQNFTQWAALADFLQLTQSQRNEILATPHFPLNLPLRLAQKIKKQSLDDPILRQFLPTKNELESAKGFDVEPVKDLLFRRGPKLLQKYHGRALLVCTSACAMNCRFCFRQNFDYDVEDKTFSEELKAISEDTSIKEVILSGGDPLSLSDRILHYLLKSLSAIPHVERLRFHTRFPIGIPERVDASFIETLKGFERQIWFTIHCNHPNELDNDVLRHLKQLHAQGIVLLNQTVLLRGVNDNVTTLKQLCEKLVNHGIFPYYLHQLDRVQGAAHFEVPEEEGRALVAALSGQLSGYAVPKYVREIPGEPGKTAL